MKLSVLVGIVTCLFLISGLCNSQNTTGGNEDESEDGGKSGPVYYKTDEFAMGADLSYVNQILDHGDGLFLEYAECRWLCYIFGENSLVDGYPAAKEGYMVDLTQEVIDGGSKKSSTGNPPGLAQT